MKKIYSSWSKAYSNFGRQNQYRSTFYTYPLSTQSNRIIVWTIGFIKSENFRMEEAQPSNIWSTGRHVSLGLTDKL